MKEILIEVLCALMLKQTKYIPKGSSSHFHNERPFILKLTSFQFHKGSEWVSGQLLMGGDTSYMLACRVSTC